MEYYKFTEEELDNMFNHAMDIVGCIKKHYAEPITIEGMAALTHTSRKDFCRRFKQFTGKTLHAFLSGVRIGKALEVLNAADGDVPLTSLAHLAGYEDYTTFYRNFQKIVGVSPAEYTASRKSK